MSGDEFAKKICKIATAQIAKEHGFELISQVALDSLGDIMAKYLEEIGQSSHNNCETARRTEVNFNDVRYTFRDLGVSLDELVAFARLAEDMPPAKSIPEFPLKYSGVEKKEDPLDEQTQRGKHIPAFLPPFPPPHTYGDTPAYEERLVDPKAIRKAKSKEKRQMETSLANLNNKLGNKPIVNYDSSRKNGHQTKSGNEDFMELENGTSDGIRPTPVHRESTFMETVQSRKSSESNDESSSSVHDADNKRSYSELEESERVRKRQRAEQLLSHQHDEENNASHNPPVNGGNVISHTDFHHVEKL